MLTRYLLVFACFLLDGAIAMAFPPAFGGGTMYFVPCLGFSALVLTIRHLDFVDSLIISILFGMFYDFFYTFTPFLYTFIFTIMCLLVRVWIKQINESMVENVILCVATIFVKELLVFGTMIALRQTTMAFNTWLVDRIFLTLLVNAILVLVLVFISFLVDEYIHHKELQTRKEERLPWMRMK